MEGEIEGETEGKSHKEEGRERQREEEREIELNYMEIKLKGNTSDEKATISSLSRKQKRNTEKKTDRHNNTIVSAHNHTERGRGSSLEQCVLFRVSYCDGMLFRLEAKEWSSERLNRPACSEHN